MRAYQYLYLFMDIYLFLILLLLYYEIFLLPHAKSEINDIHDHRPLLLEARHHNNKIFKKKSATGPKEDRDTVIIKKNHRGARNG